jgi:hypothetical protein
VPVWCQDEAGPYQAIPQPGTSWQPEGKPALRPSEYIRGGTAKLLTLFHPKTGEVRAKGVEQSTNAILHPWLKEGLSAILDALPAVETLDPEAIGHRWTDWGWTEVGSASASGKPRSPVRMALIWDNLAGHTTPDVVAWCVQRGIALLYTPLGGSWLNLAESVQRILVRRALEGQSLETPEAVIQQLEATVRGWNREPTPFEWGGKRWDRRQRARERRHALGASGGFTRTPISRPKRRCLLQRHEKALSTGSKDYPLSLQSGQLTH